MSDLMKTIKMIMNYISNKKENNTEQIDNKACYILTIKKDLFFKNHVSKSLEKTYSNDKLNDLFKSYCKDNFSENNISLYK